MTPLIRSGPAKSNVWFEPSSAASKVQHGSHPARIQVQNKCFQIALPSISLRMAFAMNGGKG